MGKGRERFVSVPRKTVVWWDINSCPVPDGVDPGCVRASIESALRKKSPGFDLEPQQVTIFAIGNLLRVPHLHNKAISSSGIFMRHAHFGLGDFFDDWCRWKCFNDPPATVMFITEYPHAEEGYYSYLSNAFLGRGKYTVIPVYPTARGDSLRWETLLKETTATTNHHHLSQMLEDGLPRWSCLLCQYGCHTYRDFANHLYGSFRKYELSTCNQTFEVFYEYLQKFIKNLFQKRDRRRR